MTQNNELVTGKEKGYLKWSAFWMIIYIVGLLVSDYHLSTRGIVGGIIIILGVMGAVNRATLLSKYQDDKEKLKEAKQE